MIARRLIETDQLRVRATCGAEEKRRDEVAQLRRLALAGAARSLLVLGETLLDSDVELIADDTKLFAAHELYLRLILFYLAVAVALG